MADTQLITEIASSISDYSVKGFEEKDSLVSYLSSLKSTIVFVDKKVFELHPELQILDNIELFESLETNKFYEKSDSILNAFCRYQLKKNGTIIVIGGGIIQDMVGFCCSIYARGVDYFLVPTTLLAQCDSCIGGKTSINFGDRKNLIGTFFPPKEVLICTEFIDTLTDHDFLSGLGEIYKFACLQNKTDAFEARLPQYKQRSGLYELVKECLVYKGSIIVRDEFDTGERKLLNFGHTFGHALESTSNYYIPHGSAVAIGILIAYAIALKTGRTDEQTFGRIGKITAELTAYLQLEKEWFHFEALLNLIKSDKKNTGRIVMVLPAEPAFSLVPFDEKELRIIYNDIFESVKAELNIK